jgi:hypothetical protein
MKHPSRWPVIRHIRFAILKWRWLTWWETVGCYLGAVPNPADIDHLDAVWKGDA